MRRAFFGFGSLVNQKTHDFLITPAELKGWRRQWIATTVRDFAFLSALPDPSTDILGVTAVMADQNWSDLDRREYAYRRVNVSGRFAEHDETVVYQVAPQNIAQNLKPLLLSYLDVVVQGFFAIGGEVAVTNFFQTTQGWDGGIYDDRAHPIYPRAQVLTGAETELCDQMCSDFAVTRVP